MPGLFYATPPRRVDRNRKDDRLVLWLRLVGSAPLSPTATEELLNRCALTYYQSHGTVTAALREAADGLNQFLLERNLRNTRIGKQSIGLLATAVIRGNILYLGLAGPGHAFFLSNTFEHWHDPQMAGRGLGLGKNTSIRFFQVELSPGTALIFSPEPPQTWTANSLLGGNALPLEQLRRRLLNQQTEVDALVVLFREGLGRITPVQPRVSPAAAPAPDTAVSQLLPTESTPVQASGEAPGQKPPQVVMQAVALPPSIETKVVEETVEAPEEMPVAASSIAATVETPSAPPEYLIPSDQGLSASVPMVADTSIDSRDSRSVPPVQAEPAPGGGEVVRAARRRAEQNSQASPGRRPPDLQSFWQGLYSAVVTWRKNREAVSHSVKQFSGRLLPGGGEQTLTLTNGQMLFIAIAVPLIIVAIASVVYFQRGRDRQYQAYFVQAQAAAAQTINQKDPAIIRAAWEQTLVWLNKADNYKITPQSQILRQQAQGYLDQADSVVRLTFQPAIVGGLAATVNVVQMAATLDDLYLLDGNTGRVIRSILTARGYEVDPNFQCAPGPFGGAMISPIVAISSLPLGNSLDATVMGLDKNGNVLYCFVDQPPLASTLKPPDNGWGKIIAFTLDSNRMYILDSKKNAIWIYDGGVGDFTGDPVLYFTHEIPPMADAVDLAMNNNDLFLLHADGHMTTCTRDSLAQAPTRCADPAVYADPRPGRQPNVALLPGAQFSHIIYTSLPEASLYMLAPQAQSIYLLSLKLNLRQVMVPVPSRSSLTPTTPATSFFINPTQTVFLAFGSQVFYTQASP